MCGPTLMGPMARRDATAPASPRVCVVQYDGSVLWIPTALFMSTCQIDITNFPFDVQSCNLKFGLADSAPVGRYVD